MERLTIDEVIEQAREVAEKKYTEGMLCHANPNDDLLDGCIKCAEEHEQLAEWLEKLKAYEQAEEDGLLIRLPCRVGDALYHIGKNNLYDCRFIGLVYDICNKEWICEIAIERGLKWAKTTCSMDCIGKTVFLTKAEAEQALAKMKGEM